MVKYFEINNKKNIDDYIIDEHTFVKINLVPKVNKLINVHVSFYFNESFTTTRTYKLYCDKLPVIIVNNVTNNKTIYENIETDILTFTEDIVKICLITYKE